MVVVVVVLVVALPTTMTTTTICLRCSSPKPLAQTNKQTTKHTKVSLSLIRAASVFSYFSRQSLAVTVVINSSLGAELRACCFLTPTRLIPIRNSYKKQQLGDGKINGRNHHLATSLYALPACCYDMIYFFNIIYEA